MMMIMMTTMMIKKRQKVDFDGDDTNGQDAVARGLTFYWKQYI